ncbi:hypothetical protein WR25_07994 [Diploscapter pachys]|uniref:SSD domain-containing protein n=1 Tax=Diploscapter pachys TaxID=2018661 RepID=A0A2A2JPU3_9BILA|nr:hypothetical protein WR25_07994 [Diploscapter pachys]
MNFAGSQNKLPSSFPEDRAVFPSDGPIFDGNMTLSGYYISVPSRYKLKVDDKSTKALFNNIDTNCERLQRIFNVDVFCMSSSEVTRFFDITNTMSSSTVSSVSASLIISLLVVALCTRHVLISLLSIFIILSIIFIITAILLLFGWQLGVVESTILVLTIGLSFDYTLHYAIALKKNDETDIVLKLRQVA